MHRGYVKLHRSLTDWEWYTEPNMVLFFVHCLLRANHKDGTWKGQDVLKGQFISGRKVLSVETGLSERNVRTCIDKLVKSGELTIKTTNKNTVFTLNKWNLYQNQEEGDQQNANKRPTNDQQPTTNKNVNNDKNEENIKYTVAESFIELWNSTEGIQNRSFKSNEVKIKVFKKISSRFSAFKEEGFNNFFMNLKYSSHIFDEKWFTLDFCIKNDENFQKVIDMWMDWKKNKPKDNSGGYCLASL